MTTESLRDRIAKFYPGASLTEEMTYELSSEPTEDVGLVVGDAGPQSEAWVRLRRAEMSRPVDVRVLKSAQRYEIFGPRRFLRAEGARISVHGFGEASEGDLRRGPILFEDESRWILSVELEPASDRVTVAWFDPEPLGPGEPVPMPPFDVWERAGGEASVIAWARSRLEADEELGILPNWTRLVVAGGLLRLRLPTEAELRELDEAERDTRVPRPPGTDAIVRQWGSSLDPRTIAYYRRVAVKTAQGVADTLEELAADVTTDMSSEHRAALVGQALESREDVACAFAVLTGEPPDYDEVAKADSRACEALDFLPYVSVALAIPRLRRAAFWDVDAWWLGHHSPEAEVDGELE